MELSFGSYALAMAAGMLSTLSPCVLPILPIVVSSASSGHRYGPWALALGLALSFTAIGMLLSTFGLVLGLSGVSLQHFGATLLMGVGVLLMSTPLQSRLAAAAVGIGNIGNMLLARFSPEGLSGQFFVGLALGLVWAPCSGPTLGAATALAATGHHLAQVALLMWLFGLGAGMPLVFVGSLSSVTLSRLRIGLLSAGSRGKFILGLMLLLWGLSIWAGWNRLVESYLTNHSPEWLTHLTTRY